MDHFVHTAYRQAAQVAVCQNFGIVHYGVSQISHIWCIFFSQVAKENVLSPLAKLTKGIQNIGASLKKGGEEIGCNAELEVAAAGAFDRDAAASEVAAANDLRERARNTSSKTKFIIL